MDNNNPRPKIGLALSGGSGRAIAHIGVLEVLREHNIPIDYIAACSSGTVVAASFACGTMDHLKNTLFQLDKKSLLELVALDEENSGVFSLERFEVKLKEFTLGKKFEDVRPHLNFIACDLNTAETVCLNLGDLAHASRVSSSVPGLFSPVQWGNRLLVDGGLFSVIPTKEARDMGANIIIGVDIAAARHIISKRYARVWQGYNFIKKSFPMRIFGQMMEFVDKLYDRTLEVVFYNQSDYLEKDHAHDPTLFSVLSQAMEVIAHRDALELADFGICDIMLAPDVKKYGPLSVESSRAMYQEGRDVALSAVPEIKKLIQNYEKN